MIFYMLSNFNHYNNFVFDNSGISDNCFLSNTVDAFFYLNKQLLFINPCINLSFIPLSESSDFVCIFL